MSNNYVTIQNAKLIFRNFAGAENDYNREGKRTFSVILEEQQANELESQGWNVRRKEGDDSREALITLPIKVVYTDRSKPTIILITGEKKEILSEDRISLIDTSEIIHCDLVIRPYHYNVNGQKGISAYLQSMAVEIEADYIYLTYLSD